MTHLTHRGELSALWSDEELKIKIDLQRTKSGLTSHSDQPWLEDCKYVCQSGLAGTGKGGIVCQGRTLGMCLSPFEMSFPAAALFLLVNCFSFHPYSGLGSCPVSCRSSTRHSCLLIISRFHICEFTSLLKFNPESIVIHGHAQSDGKFESFNTRVLS